jgi:hypothetical protein
MLDRVITAILLGDHPANCRDHEWSMITAELDGQVRAHLANPDVVMVSHLLFAVWGHRPAE